MVDCVSEATDTCMENPTGGKVQENGGVFCDTVKSILHSLASRHTWDALSPSLHPATSQDKQLQCHLTDYAIPRAWRQGHVALRLVGVTS